LVVNESPLPVPTQRVSPLGTILLNVLLGGSGDVDEVVIMKEFATCASRFATHARVAMLIRKRITVSP